MDFNSNTLTRMLSRTFITTLFALILGIGGNPHAQEPPRELIKVLLITRGPDQDFGGQKNLITAGISERCRIPIEWTVIPEATNISDKKISLFEQENWAEGFDLVIHNECYPKVNDSDLVKRILKPHQDGIPALLIYCALHSFPLDSDQWRDFCGANTSKSEASPPFKIIHSDQKHPVTTPLSNWKTTVADLVDINEMSASATVLSHSQLDEEATLQPNTWVHEYGKNKARVFATAIGYRDETQIEPEYYDLLTSGLLWAIGEDLKDNLIIRKISDAPDDYILKPGRNLLTNQPAKSSSKNADLAIDGNPATVWKADKGETINWWQASLSKTVDMSSLIIIWEEEIKHPFWIETSLDGRNWNRLAETPPLIRAKRFFSYQLKTTFQHLRISNPQTGVLGGIAEIAAYKTLRHTPSHLISAAYNRSERPRVLHQPVSKERIYREPVLIPSAAFSLLDDPDTPLKWAIALEELALTYESEVVDGLILRINSTNSGKFRHRAIECLTRLYRNHEGKQWAKSPQIATYIESLFNHKRFDKERLLAGILRENIPVRDISAVINSLKDNPGLNQHQLNLLEKNRIPFNGLYVLGDIVKDDSETPENRLRAGILLAQSTDMLAMRNAFELAARSVEFEDPENFRDRLKQRLAGNLTWEAQFDWLLGKTVSENEQERRLAWEIVIVVYEDPESRTHSKKIASEAFKNSEQVADNSFFSLITVVSETQNQSLQAIVNRFVKTPGVSETVLASLVKPVPNQNVETLDMLTIAEVKKFVKTNTDANLINGELLYRKNCSICHSKKGPALKDLAATDLYSAILTPDSHIASEYATYEFTMSDNNVYSGFISNSSETEVDIIDQAGNSVTLEKENIMVRKQHSFSTMPLNVTDHFTAKEFADLIAWLESI